MPVEPRPKIVIIRVTRLAISLTAARDLVWDMYLFVEPIRSVRAFIASIPSRLVCPSLGPRRTTPWIVGDES